MYINAVKSVNAVNYYLYESYRNEKGQTRSRIVEKLGNVDEIKRKFNVTDVDAWCKEYAKQRTAEAKKASLKNYRKVTVVFEENKDKSPNSAIFNAGYFILDSVYHSFGLSNICEEIRLKHPHVKGFNLNDVLRAMLFGRIVSPSSKLRLVSNIQGKFLENNKLQVQHVYSAMDLLEKHIDLIQKRLFQYTTVALKERNASRLYYDCTNFYSEKELEDCDVSDKSEEWHSEHTLRKYGASKEHRPNPIVQMGLFMDGDGMPLGFCINPGNTSEQVTMKPLENELIKYFNTTDIVVCTDAGLASLDNRLLNNVTEENDPLADFGFKGKRHFICVQSIRGKSLNSTLKEWAIDRKGWSYKIRKGNKVETIENFDLNNITDDKRAEFYNVIFYKERTIAENNLDQRLIMIFSLKYQDYQRALRQRKLKRAEKMIDSGSYKYERDTSPRAYVSQDHTTDNGEKATKTKATINKQKAENDALYDGFYCTATNLFKEQCSVQQIIAIAQRRWEVEECFRIMKTDLKSSPFYHNKDSRIVAHFQTCFMALLLIMGIERKIAKHHIDNLKYPEGKYTVPEILDAIRELSLISIAEGQAFAPDYNNSELMSELLECFDLKELGKQIVMKDTLKNILKKIKTSPEMIIDD